MTATGRQIDLGASAVSATSGFNSQGFITAAGVSAIAGVSDLDATGRATFVGASTIVETSGFVSIGGLKWEDIIVPGETWTEQTVASDTWTNQTNPSTTWKTLDKQEAA